MKARSQFQKVTTMEKNIINIVQDGFTQESKEKQQSMLKNASYKIRSNTIGNTNKKNNLNQTQGASNQLWTKNIKTAIRKSAKNVQKDQLDIKKQTNTHTSVIDLKSLQYWITNIANVHKDSGPNALTNLGIDKKQLMTKGITLDNIERIYRCLFVYSYGFYQMLNQICENSSDQVETKSNIWKIYSTLLENCNKGEFQFVLTKIDNENEHKLKQLQEQMEMKEKNLIHSNKNDKIKISQQQEEINSLVSEKQQIEQQKFRVESFFKLADQAFTDEVGLRLKFELKVNQIYGIHRELSIKHNKLLDDFKIINKDNNKNKLKIDELNQKIIVLNKSCNQINDENQVLNVKLTQANNSLNILTARRPNEEKEKGSKDYQIYNLNQRIHENNSKISKLDFQIANQKSNIDSQNLTIDHQKRNLVQLVQQSESQSKLIQELYQQIEKYENEKDESNKNQTKIEIGNYKLKENLENLNMDFLNQQNIMKQEKQEKDEFKLQILQQKHIIDKQLENIIFLEKTQSEMKTKSVKIQNLYIDLKEDFEELEQKYNSISEGTNKSEIEFENCKNLLKIQVQENENLKNQFEKQKKEYKLFVEIKNCEHSAHQKELVKLENQNDITNQQFWKVEAENFDLDQKVKDNEIQLISKDQQIEKLKFQTKTEQETIDTLNGKIILIECRQTETIVILEDIKTQLASKECVIQEIKENKCAQKALFKHQIQKLEQKLKYKSHLRDPMEFEDLESHLQRQYERTELLSQKINEMQKQLNQKDKEIYKLNDLNDDYKEIIQKQKKHKKKLNIHMMILLKMIKYFRLTRQKVFGHLEHCRNVIHNKEKSIYNLQQEIQDYNDNIKNHEEEQKKYEMVLKDNEVYLWQNKHYKQQVKDQLQKIEDLQASSGQNSLQKQYLKKLQSIKLSESRSSEYLSDDIRESCIQENKYCPIQENTYIQQQKENIQYLQSKTMEQQGQISKNIALATIDEIKYKFNSLSAKDLQDLQQQLKKMSSSISTSVLQDIFGQNEYINQKDKKNKEQQIKNVITKGESKNSQNVNDVLGQIISKHPEIEEGFDKLKEYNMQVNTIQQQPQNQTSKSSKQRQSSSINNKQTLKSQAIPNSKTLIHTEQTLNSKAPSKTPQNQSPQSQIVTPKSNISQCRNSFQKDMQNSSQKDLLPDEKKQTIIQPTNLQKTNSIQNKNPVKGSEINKKEFLKDFERKYFISRKYYEQ